MVQVIKVVASSSQRARQTKNNNGVCYHYFCTNCDDWSGGTGTSTSTGNAGADTSIGTILVAKGGIAGKHSYPIYGGGNSSPGCIKLMGEINISNNSGTAQGGGGSWLQGFVSGVASKYGAGGETTNGSGSGW